MGAASFGQAASDAVIVARRRLLTCADAVTWPVWPVEHCVRIEGVRGSNPLSSTSRADFEHGIGPFSVHGLALGAQLERSQAALALHQGAARERGLAHRLCRAGHDRSWRIRGRHLAMAVRGAASIN